MRTCILFFLLLCSVTVSYSQESGLTLDMALSQAALTHPDLLAAGQEVIAANERSEQAGAWNNPTLFLKIEDAPHNGDIWNNSNRIWGLSQQIPWAGRLSAAAEAARAETDFVDHNRQWVERSVQSDVRTAFATVLYARDASALHRKGVDIARRLLDLTMARVDLGDAPEVDLLRARMELCEAETQLARAQVLLSSSKARLATNMGVDIESVTTVTGDLFDDSPIEPLADLLGRLESAPRLCMAAATLSQRQARITEASRQRYPDLELEAGLRRAPEGDSFDAGISISIPILDRGGARLSAAKADAAAAQWQMIRQHNLLESSIRDVHAIFSSSAGTVKLYDEVVIPDADAALNSVEVSYNAGDADLTGVLQVTRDWLDTQFVRLEALLEMALARADLLQLL